MRLWAANGISQLGTQVTLLALPLAALFVLKASALEVALLRSFAVLPFLLVSLPAGVWIDRVRRRPLMIVADLGRAAAMASIPVAYWLGHLSIAQLYVVAGVHGFLSVLFDLSYLSFLPTLVSRIQLGEANARLLGTQSVAQVAGPTLAGGLVAAFGAPVAVLADAVSFLLSGGFVSRIRAVETLPPPTGTRKRDELVEGLRYVWGQPYLRTLTVWTSLWNLFTSGFFALEIVYFVRGLGWGPTRIGVVIAIATSGLVLGSLVNQRLVARLGVGPMIANTGIVFSVLLAVVPGAPRAWAAPAIAAGGFVASVVGFFANVNQLTLRQSITPPRLLGRMNAVVRTMYWGSIPLGSALGGLAAGWVGLRTTLFVAAAGAAASCVPIVVSPIRKLRELPEPPPEPALSVRPLSEVRSTVESDARAPGDGGVAAPAR